MKAAKRKQPRGGGWQWQSPKAAGIPKWQSPKAAGIPNPESGKEILNHHGLWYSEQHGFYLYEPNSRAILVNGKHVDFGAEAHEKLYAAWRNPRAHEVNIRMTLSASRPLVKRLSMSEAAAWCIGSFTGAFLRYVNVVTTDPDCVQLALKAPVTAATEGKP